MYKPSAMEIGVISLIGLGTVVALAYTDFGWWGAALVGIFTVLAEYLRLARKSARRDKLAPS